MLALPTYCPFCHGELVVTEFSCRQCDVTSHGRFTPGPVAEFEAAQLPVLRRFARLSSEQLELMETFVRCEGKLNRLQEEVGLSYPTLRSRLNDMLQAMGFTPQQQETMQRVERKQVLDDLAAGKITAAEAATLLREARA
jgi:hypothetical protein